MGKPQRFRLKRRQIYEDLFSARSLCVTGLLVMPSLMLNPGTASRAFQFLFFWLLAWLAGRKNNPLFTVLTMLFITAFNLAVPYGRILCAIGPFKITSGALETGIRRAVTLEGMIMISRFSIREDLVIPGGFGKLAGESFRIFSIIMARKHRITRKRFIDDIDRLLLDLSGETGAAPPALAKCTKPGGLALLGLIVILAWLPVFR